MEIASSTPTIHTIRELRRNAEIKYANKFNHIKQQYILQKRAVCMNHESIVMNINKSMNSTLRWISINHNLLIAGTNELKSRELEEIDLLEYLININKNSQTENISNARIHTKANDANHNNEFKSHTMVVNAEQQFQPVAQNIHDATTASIGSVQKQGQHQIHNAQRKTNADGREIIDLCSDENDKECDMEQKKCDALQQSRGVGKHDDVNTKESDSVSPTVVLTEYDTSDASDTSMTTSSIDEKYIKFVPGYHEMTFKEKVDVVRQKLTEILDNQIKKYGYRKWECKFCECIYASKISLKRHICRDHCEMKPWKCLWCKKGFASSYLHNQHRCYKRISKIEGVRRNKPIGIPKLYGKSIYIRNLQR